LYGVADGDGVDFGVDVEREFEVLALPRDAGDAIVFFLVNRADGEGGV
jgi:hypothetical protein